MKNLKKLFILVLVIALSLTAFVGCQNNQQNEDKGAEKAPEAEQPANRATTGKITVAASPTPHAEILAQVKDVLAEQGYELEVVEFTDYVQPNSVVDAGDLDANFFQHKPYLDNFNEEKGNPTSICFR